MIDPPKLTLNLFSTIRTRFKERLIGGQEGGVFMCSPKTMLKIGAVIAVPLAVGFIAFPQFRPVILSYAPLAIFALCPLSMLFMGGMMGNKKGSSCSSCGPAHAEAKHGKADEKKQ